MKKSACLIFFWICLFSRPAQAATYSLAYAGRLSEPGGAPTTGPVNLRARFFRAATGGTALAGDMNLSGVSLTQGYFQITLNMNDTDLHTIFPSTGTDAYIELTDVTNNRTFPRQRFPTIPYALKIPVDGSTLQYSSNGALQVKELPGVASTGTIERTGVGSFATYPVSAFAKTLLDDADAPTARATLGIPELPTGSVIPYAGATAPTGYLLADGAAVSRTTYAALFAIIGTTYGAGNGTTTFNLPDLRGRSPIGAGQGTGLTNRALAATGGTETHTLAATEMPTHTHGVTDPGHAHLQNVRYSSAAIGGGSGPLLDGGGANNYQAWTNSHATGISLQNSGGGAAHNNMPPFLTLNYIIKM